MGIDIGIANPFRHPPGVPRSDEPRAEGRFHLAGGRRLGYAEYGDPTGAVVLWFHGVPGGRRQLPPAARRAADELRLRVVLVERPGWGLSDAHEYADIADWADDVLHIADALGADRFGVAGFCSGGPYALGCAASPELAHRVAAVAILGGRAPVVGRGRAPAARRLGDGLSILRRPVGGIAATALTPMLPLGHLLYRGISAVRPGPDRRVLADPEIEAMVVDDLVVSVRGRVPSLIHDDHLLDRYWGFRLTDVAAPVCWWHGDADPVTSLGAAASAVQSLPDAELVAVPGAGHLVGWTQGTAALRFVGDRLAAAHRSQAGVRRTSRRSARSTVR